MRAKLSGLWSSFLTFLLGALGFSSCDGIGPFYGPDMYGAPPMMCEYGTPTADYVVKGTVKDDAGNPLKGIRAVVKIGDDPWRPDTLYTDDSGKFASKKSEFPGQAVTILYEDIDGPENGGSFKADSTIVENPQKTDNGDGNWNEGTYTVEDEKVLQKAE